MHNPWRLKRFLTARVAAIGGAYLLLAVGGITMLMPLAWMALTAFKDTHEVFRADSGFLPSIWRWHNYVEVWQRVSLLRYYLNSLSVAVAVTLGQVFICSMAAYAFARLRFPGRHAIFFALLGTMMVPVAVTMVPVFIILRTMGWLDTYAALIIPPLFSAYGTFMLRQFFLSIPRELEEAALIDGCGPVGIYWRIVLPLSKPALAALAIFTFTGNWRSFTWPLIVTSSDKTRTLPLGVASFAQAYEVDWPLLMAASVLMTIPMAIIFVLGQRYFMSGIQLGGVKG